MSNIQDGADALYVLVERDRNLLVLAEALKGLGSLEQTITERKATLAEATQQHEAAKALLISTREELAEAQTAHAQELADHAVDMGALAASSQAEVDRIFNQARAEANHTVQSAKDEAARVQKAHAETMAQANAVLSEVSRQVSEAQVQLATLVAEHAAVSAATEAMKRAAAAVVGRQ